jgi:hypothetical protein
MQESMFSEEIGKAEIPASTGMTINKLKLYIKN